jgi:hypothetical protein
MRTIIEMKKAERILSAYFPVIASSAKEGFADYLDMIRYTCQEKNRLISFNSRTKATLIHNLITERIAENFKSKRIVKAKECNRIFGLFFKDRFFLRFKKFNSRLAPSVSPTRQTIRYEGQQCTIPGFPKQVTLLYVGYTFNSTMTGIGNIYISCRVKGSPKWMIDFSKHLSPGAKEISFSAYNKSKNKIKVRQLSNLRKAS